MSQAAYKRILLKISGEVLAGDQSFGIDSRMIEYIASEIAEVVAMVFAAGTGNPYFSTDTAAALRAMEIGAEIILKGTKVSGIYDDDPMKNPRATKYTKLSFLAVIDKRLKVMDSTAISLCMDHNLPIIVFNVKEKGNIKRIVRGEQLGTLVHDEPAPA